MGREALRRKPEIMAVLRNTGRCSGEGMRYQDEAQSEFEVHPLGRLSVSHARAALFF